MFYRIDTRTSLAEGVSLSTSARNLKCSSDSFVLCFDEKMNLTEMKIRGEEWRFEEGSHYFISGKEAQIKTVEYFPSSIVAHLESESATAKLIISSGKRVTIKMHVKSTLAIESIDIVIPFPEDSQMIKTKEMPAGDEVPFIPNDLVLRSSFIDVGNSYLMFGIRSKKLYFSNSKFIKTKQGLTISWNWEPKAPFPKEYETPELCFDAYESRDEVIKEYQEYLERTFSIKKKEENPLVPDWLAQTRLILALDLWTSLGDISHNYQDIINLIKEMRKIKVPSDTIVYINGWSWKYDGHYPEYWPAEELGGARKFKEMVDIAHACQFHVMPHFNCQGFDPELPSFQEFSQYQQRDPYGNRREHPEPIVQHPPDWIAYMDPSQKKWREYLIGKVIKPVREFGLDAIYWDQFSWAGNTLTDQLGGQIKLLEELRAEIPGTLFGGKMVGHESTMGMGAPGSSRQICLGFFPLHCRGWL